MRTAPKRPLTAFRISVRLPERFGSSALHLRHTTKCVLQRVLRFPVLSFLGYLRLLVLRWAVAALPGSVMGYEIAQETVYTILPNCQPPVIRNQNKLSIVSKW